MSKRFTAYQIHLALVYFSCAAPGFLQPKLLHVGSGGFVQAIEEQTS